MLSIFLQLRANKQRILSNQANARGGPASLMKVSPELGYWGMFMPRSRAWKRGSERRGSQSGCALM